MKIPLMVVISLLTVLNAYAVDIDLEKGTFFNLPFQDDYLSIFNKVGKPNHDDDSLKKYNDKGFYVSIANKNIVEAYDIFLLKGTDNEIQYAPSDIKPFTGTISFGVRQGSRFNEILGKIIASKRDYIAYRGTWDLSYPGQNNKVSGYIIQLRIKYDYTCEMYFSANGMITSIKLLNMPYRGFEGRVTQLIGGESGNMQIVNSKNSNLTGR